MYFEWDTNKDQINIKKHGIMFDTAIQVFEDENHIIVFDKEHSIYEDRYLCIGKIDGTMLILTVVFTENMNSIRIISARKANKDEERAYYDKKS